MTNKLKKQDGISLMEVMISMLILSIGILGMVPLITMSIYNNTFSSDMTNYNAVAQEHLEQLIGMPSYPALPFSTEESGDNGHCVITKKVVDNASDGSVPVGLYKIIVDVAWTDDQGIARNISYINLKPAI